MFLAVGTVQAQPADDDTGEPKAGAGMGVEAKMTPQEMSREADALLTRMESVLRRVVELQQGAREQKDIIKLNCVNDKLLQIKQLLNIADMAKSNLIEAIAARNEGDRYHRYSQIVVAADKTAALRDEAEACIGEELVFLGPTAVEVDKPVIIDDPTKQDPFYFGEVRIERPAYATPYL